MECKQFTAVFFLSNFPSEHRHCNAGESEQKSTKAHTQLIICMVQSAENYPYISHMDAVKTETVGQRRRIEQKLDWKKKYEWRLNQIIRTTQQH